MILVEFLTLHCSLSLSFDAQITYPRMHGFVVNQLVDFGTFVFDTLLCCHQCTVKVFDETIYL